VRFTDFGNARTSKWTQRDSSWIVTCWNGVLNFAPLLIVAKQQRKCYLADSLSFACVLDHGLHGFRQLIDYALRSELEQRVPMPIDGASAHATRGVRRSRGTEITDERKASWQPRSFGVHRQDSPSQTPAAGIADRPPREFCPPLGDVTVVLLEQVGAARSVLHRAPCAHRHRQHQRGETLLRRCATIALLDTI